MSVFPVPHSHVIFPDAHKDSYPWRIAEVVQVARGAIKISYQNYPPTYDEWIQDLEGSGATRIQAPFTVSMASREKTARTTTIVWLVSRRFAPPCGQNTRRLVAAS